MDPYPSVRHEHNFHFDGRDYPWIERQLQISNLAGGLAVYRGVDRHIGHVAKRLCITGILLVARAGRRYFCRCILLRFDSGIVGDVGKSEK